MTNDAERLFSAYGPFVSLLLWNVYLNLLPIFKLDSLFIIDLYKFFNILWVQVQCQNVFIENIFSKTIAWFSLS